MTASSGIRAALFDIDGTLVDSNDAHARTWVDAFAESHIAVPFERIRPLIGMATDNVFASLGIEVDSRLKKTITDRRRELFLQRELPALRVFAGAREAVEAFARRGIACVVASSASPVERDALLALIGLSDAFADAVDPDEAEEGKPGPDVVVAALRKRKISAAQAVMIGDTSYDMESAKRAGVRCIALRCGGNDPASLPGADAMYDDPAALARAIEAGDQAVATSWPGQERERKGMEQSSFGSLSSRLVGAARDFLSRQFESQTKALGTQISSGSRDLDALAQTLNGSATMGAAAPLAQWAARNVSIVGTYLENRGAPELIADFESIARERPSTVFASAAALGVVAARIVKSSGFSRSRESYVERNSDRVSDTSPIAAHAAGIMGSSSTSERSGVSSHE